jgi:hypothetical protein
MTSSISFYLLGLVCLGFLGAATHATAQTNPTPVPMPNAMVTQPGAKLLDGQRVYRYVEKMPRYLDGGKGGLQAAITSRVRGGDASGKRAFVTFVVDQQGVIRNPAFGVESEAEAANIDPGLAEAFAAIGKFRPGTQNGKPVNVEMTMPIVQRTKK